ncbi:YihY/virulence factor BrkB family protein [Blastococcus saxobsidens]|uniref:YihY family inner membrane protein n=1 Tax=Blastococcus saxobsidens TaxID=138336 RepID=A0A4Q7Y7J1_9ACTN|nr:YihY/virulence factor BrkB family protein [Blastococcus saxobsidens]RZU31925.1 YihY family inner membrane protein [Blastococcus saxobsidens]
MSSVARVPEVSEATGGPVTAREAWAGVRSDGARAAGRELASRFRYGDGFSHARALAFQLALAALPLVIAAVGLAGAWDAASVRLVLNRTVLQLTPGASDDLLRRTLPSGDTTLATAALLLAAVSALVALTTAMAQVERGANRLYGIQRDRPSVEKYRRALTLSLVAGVPLMVGSLLILTRDAFAEAVESVYAVDDDLVAAWTGPAGLVLVVASLMAVLRSAPARQQPGWPVLLAGSLLAVGAWTGLTLLLAGFLHLSTGFGSVYGPVTGVIALLLWAQLSATALFFGVAVSAELEMAAVRTRWRTGGLGGPPPAGPLPSVPSSRSPGDRPRREEPA